MSAFKITWSSGDVLTILKEDCITLEHCAMSMFGHTVEEVEVLGAKIEELAIEEYHKLIGREELNAAQSAVTEEPQNGTSQDTTA